MAIENTCHFCETSKNVNGLLYISKFVDGKYKPVQVPVCKACKDEYETSFPKH